VYPAGIACVNPVKRGVRLSHEYRNPTASDASENICVPTLDAMTDDALTFAPVLLRAYAISEAGPPDCGIPKIVLAFVELPADTAHLLPVPAPFRTDTIVNAGLPAELKSPVSPASLDHT
jgi:hypothetical protein